MKGYTLLVLAGLHCIAVLFFSCATAEAPGPMEADATASGMGVPAQITNLEVAELVKEWEQALRNGDRETLAGLYWPKCITRFISGDGKRFEFVGPEASTEFRLFFFDDLGPPEDYGLPADAEVWVDEHDRFGFGLHHDSDPHAVEYTLWRREGAEWRIEDQEIIVSTPGPFVVNRYQATHDHDGDGFLVGSEHHELKEATRVLLSGPHRVRDSLDKVFDLDFSGRLEEAEIRNAGDVLFLRGFQLALESPYDEWLREQLDLNGDGVVRDEELGLIHSFMTGDPALNQPRPTKNALDRFIDLDEDGSVVELEIHEAWERFAGITANLSFPDALYLPVPRSPANLLDELGDGNGDGVIEADEQDMILGATSYEHHVTTYLDRAIDENHDDFVDFHDIHVILQASALGGGRVAAGAEAPYDVRTHVDTLLDADGDGLINGNEIDNVVSLIAGDTRYLDRVSRELSDLLDLVGDGDISLRAIESLGFSLILPHPVNPDSHLDRRNDVNGDGFVAPDELGVTAGVTSKGEVPSLERRVALLRRRPQQAERKAAEESTLEKPAPFQSDYYKRLGAIQDSKLAVISLDIGTSQVDEETANGVAVFVESAFVNVGKVRVVDRQNLQQILEEHEFQAKGFIDETTAVEIGKLSGADIIVIGSINRVGGLFYLNIKLIAVETAEIIGSSISQASDAGGFLDMANQAVFKLF